MPGKTSEYPDDFIVTSKPQGAHGTQAKLASHFANPAESSGTYSANFHAASTAATTTRPNTPRQPYSGTANSAPTPAAIPARSDAAESATEAEPSPISAAASTRPASAITRPAAIPNAPAALTAKPNDGASANASAPSVNAPKAIDPV